MAILNIIAYTLITVFILDIVIGILLVNKGQSRKHFMTELKIIVILLCVCFLGLGISLVTIGYLGSK
ncbi:hypothetical protein NGH74_00820 [Staphylococcus pseudoxylosus]|uniref:hypothetical protein n=1 Tax=Staphylococcus pseudoxylosus TaxID=2282419 RepID=UPI000D1D261F|nr:hypothetical protein [Staphylococcus pseudoxylosus]PTI45889.1 hypothetical protein BU120_03615 [Staphylococcus xylosus]MDW8797331.1 hypothetical protein [Staphylococcus pseudoxylosus]MEB6036361.1 hypothetical protein [Staphylococcus pseudoxylosus]MEB6044559.1 hypothetical protein [Staphylococcus pseudoxylosus]MEB6061119.1 hypothetical protein [Staphylococcus pseudoxylosus]